MLKNRRDEALAVEIPVAERDKPAWVKVGVIAAVGFVVGIAWPRVVGVRLGPSAPSETMAAAASGSAHGGRAPEAPPASVIAKGPAAATPSASVAVATPPPSAAAPPNIAVGKGVVISCKTTDGETKKGRDCGAVPGIDQIVQPRVKKIATCSGLEGQTGKFSMTVNAEFTSGRFWYEVNKTSTVQNLDAVISCLKTSFHATATTATPHEHARYTVSYTATLTAAADEKSVAARDKTDKSDPKEAKADKNAKDAPDEKAETPAPAPAKVSGSGEAEVAWEVALVRDAPKSGALVSRLPRGTKVKVSTPKDGWFLIKFGENFANEGWVYRGAIGR